MGVPQDSPEPMPFAYGDHNGYECIQSDLVLHMVPKLRYAIKHAGILHKLGASGGGRHQLHIIRVVKCCIPDLCSVLRLVD